MWKLVFINPDDWFGLRYQVLLNAETGEGILTEAFPWQQFREYAQYDLKYY